MGELEEGLLPAQFHFTACSSILPSYLPTSTPLSRRRVIIRVKAGKPVDDTIAALLQFLEPGDIIIDGGNEW